MRCADAGTAAAGRQRHLVGLLGALTQGIEGLAALRKRAQMDARGEVEAVHEPQDVEMADATTHGVGSEGASSEESDGSEGGDGSGGGQHAATGWWMKG